ncbi:MAG: hypothetical protein P0120_02300 [Nitrospira sp.]|nr:hypothetical protein [Nitrospira sp.]
MQKQITAVEAWSSREWWDHLEIFVRDHIQQFVQRLLVEEVTLRLGRAKSVRRVAGSADTGAQARALHQRRWSSGDLGRAG